MISLFSKLLIETHSSCNRECATCMRQNDPGRSRWIRGVRRNVDLPDETVYRILDEAGDLNFKGQVGFVWFNEPLMDPRLPSFAAYAKTRGLYVYIATNGDLLTPELALELDGLLNHIFISLYPGAREPRYFQSLFKKTRIDWGGPHMTSHFSPRRDLQTLISRRHMRPCVNPQNRMIITYTGEMALCCEDLACNFNLGSIHGRSLTDLWYSLHHQEIVEALSKPGGRQAYPYCRICPREGTFV